MRRSRSRFNLSHYHLTTFDMGRLIPVMTEEVLPGDTFNMSTRAMMRVSPLVTPVMHPVEVRLHYFYVPNRILWDGWEDFIAGQTDELPGNRDYVPTIVLNDANPAEMEFADYLGVPPVDGIQVSMLPCWAYMAIYNTWYRDQDLVQELDWPAQAGTSPKRPHIMPVAWEKDYFTTARPYPQNDGYSIAAPILSDDFVPEHGRASRIEQHWEQPFNDTTTIGKLNLFDLRLAVAAQNISEARNRYGDRYEDYLRWLGRNPRSGLLDMPERLGGGRATIQFSEVLAHAEGENTNVGDMAGHGIATIATRGVRRTFEEHGWVMALASVRPKTIYSESYHRKFWRRMATDFWQPEMEIMPVQEVTQFEVSVQGLSEQIFGYVPKYDEYRHSWSYVSGEFRDINDSWHLARKFSEPPYLNETFINCEPSERIFATGNVHHLLASFNHRVYAQRIVSRRAKLGIRL